MMTDRLRGEIADHLQHYVYALVDPRDSIPSCVGQGTRDRVLQYELDAAHWGKKGTSERRHQKFARIREIERAGRELDARILRRGLTATEYSRSKVHHRPAENTLHRALARRAAETSWARGKFYQFGAACRRRVHGECAMGIVMVGRHGNSPLCWTPTRPRTRRWPTPEPPSAHRRPLRYLCADPRPAARARPR